MSGYIEIGNDVDVVVENVQLAGTYQAINDGTLEFTLLDSNNDEVEDATEVDMPNVSGLAGVYRGTIPMAVTETFSPNDRFTLLVVGSGTAAGLNFRQTLVAKYRT